MTLQTEPLHDISDHLRKPLPPRSSGSRIHADSVGLRTTGAGERHLGGNPWLRFWAPHRLAWWVAQVFVVGSAFFVLGAAGSLVPEQFPSDHAMSVFAESCYFVGATLYTGGIYAQLLERINADESVEPDRSTTALQRVRWFAFETDLGFLVPFVLLLGSLVFNYETVFSLGDSLDLLPSLWLWESSVLGSLLFLVSAVLQFADAGSSCSDFDPRSASCWIALLFVLGSIGFVVGSLPGLGAPGLPTNETGPGALIVKIGFLIGGLAYLVGSYLMLPEMFAKLRERSRTRWTTGATGAGFHRRALTDPRRTSRIRTR